MQIEIKIDENCKETKIIVVTDKMTEEINEIIKRISSEQKQMIAGFKNDVVELLQPNDICHIFTESSKVYVQTDRGIYTIRLRLYELENILDNKIFIRVSNTDIINLKKVKSFDLSITGTICIKMLDGKEVYASRRSVAKIKQILGI